MYKVDHAKAYERMINPESIARKKSSQVISILKTFSRGIYNSNNMMESRFYDVFLHSEPFQIVGFWGPSDKKFLDNSDLLLLDEYRIIKQLIDTITIQQTQVTIILADAHGRFNGFNNFEQYHSRIDLEARIRALSTIKLDRLYEDWNINLPDINKPVDEILWREFIQLKQSPQLIESATKHNRSIAKPEVAAFNYWLMRQQEAEPIKRTFPNAVLFINGSRDLGMATLPRNMPHVYSRFGPVWFQ